VTCLENALVKQLKLGQTKDKKTTDVITCLGVSLLSVGIRARMIYQSSCSLWTYQIGILFLLGDDSDHILFKACVRSFTL
jgi:hypothetical protein